MYIFVDSSLSNFFVKWFLKYLFQVISEEKDQVNCNQHLPIEIDSKGLSNLEDVEVPMQDIVVWIDPLDATQEFTGSNISTLLLILCRSI